MITQDFVVKLGDFGQARTNARLMTNELGTAYFMAPEVRDRHDYSFPADVYSYGITCYEILLPDHGISLDRSKRHQPPLDGVSPEWHGYLVDCWAEDPEDRLTMRRLLTVHSSKFGI